MCRCECMSDVYSVNISMCIEFDLTGMMMIEKTPMGKCSTENRTINEMSERRKEKCEF